MKVKIMVYVSALFLLGCGGEKPSGIISRPAGLTGRDAEKTEAKVLSKETEQAARITSGDYYDSCPSWSPDGGKIAYASYREGMQNLWMVEVTAGEDGIVSSGEPVRITVGDFIDESPSWTPDGEKIVFSSNRNENPGLFVVNLSDKKVFDLQLEGISPKCASVNKRFTFVYMNNIWTARLSEKKFQRYVTDSGYNGFPCWAGDEGEIVFSSGGDLIMINRDGSERVPLTSTGWNSHPDWCSEKEELVFVSNDEGNYDLWKMKLDGSGLVQLTDGPGTEFLPAWSPDGKRIAFQADYKGSFDIWVIPVQGETAESESEKEE